jgi:cytochrome c oxidase cbb3-type subunit 3
MSSPFRDLPILLLALTAAAACDREVRDPRELAPDPQASATVANAYQMAEGKTLYSAYNCVGCHANGGGGIGPPLMDARWIYGPQPEKIHQSIVEGRPNGMPSFRGRIPEFHVQRLVAYVRSMSGLAGKLAAPSRSDHLNVKRGENTMDLQPPISESRPAPQ